MVFSGTLCYAFRSHASESILLCFSGMRILSGMSIDGIGPGILSVTARIVLWRRVSFGALLPKKEVDANDKVPIFQS